MTLADRLRQGYPLPVAGKTNPQVDQIIHDKGVHFCSDTDRLTSYKSKSVPQTGTPPSLTENNSRTWSGNIADAGGYTYVQVEWQESCIAFGTHDSFATWAGIGGYNNNNLVQAGALGENTSIYSTNIHQAVIENTAVDSSAKALYTINCGDWMWVEISQGDCMYVSDLTTGSTSGWRCYGPNFNTSTAECIVEAPTNSVTGVQPLSNYGAETLHSCQVEVNAGPNVGIYYVQHDYFNMYNGGTLLSSTGPISGGDTYTMTWHNYN